MERLKELENAEMRLKNIISIIEHEKEHVKHGKPARNFFNKNAETSEEELEKWSMRNCKNGCYLCDKCMQDIKKMIR